MEGAADMAILEEDGFNKLLKSDFNDHLFLIFGDDSYLKDYYCSKLVNRTVEESLKLFNYHVYQDDETSLEEIFADADNLPMMAEKTCLLVRNYPLNELKKDELKVFEKRLTDVPESTVLIFFYGTDDVVYNATKGSRWNAAVKLFIQYGHAIKLDHRSSAKIASMLVKRAKDRGTVIAQSEAQYFVECVGDDMQALLNEFNKLCAYSQGQQITKEMIDVTATKSVEASVFDISAAIFSGNTDKAFATANELLRQKTELQPMLGAMASAYVDIYRYKVALNAGKGYSDFAELFGYKGNQSYRFNKIASFARKSSIGSIRSAIEVLAEADVLSKSTKKDDAVLMTETIARLAACAGIRKKSQ